MRLSPPPGSESRRCFLSDARSLPRAPSPATGCYPSQGGVMHLLGEHYPSFNAPTGSCVPPPSSPRLRALPLYQESLQVAASPCWTRGGSRRYLRHPCIGAWTRTPSRPPGAPTRFFPRDSGLTSRLTRSAREIPPAQQLPQGKNYGAAVIP